MFKFIHAADVHLDSPLRGLSRYESAPAESIRNACRRAFENLVDLAIEEKVAFVLLAGDLYDGDWKDYSTGIFLSRQMGRLGQHDISVFAVAGNHDAANQMTKALDNPANMKILSSRKVETIRLDELALAIHGRSFGTQHVDENLASGFAPAERGIFNIGLLHTSLDGREGHAVYAPCSADDLRSKGYQYWALGHIHKQEFVSEDPWIVFPGCIQGRHIREAGAKGCVLVTVEDGAVSAVEKCPLDVMRWVECSVDLTELPRCERYLNALESPLKTKEHQQMDDRSQCASVLKGQPQYRMSYQRFRNDLINKSKQLARKLPVMICGSRESKIQRSANSIWNLHCPTTSTFGKLLKDILATPNSPDEISGLKDVIADLRQKIPSEAFGADSILNLDESQTVDRLVDEAKHMLVGRLLTVGGAK